MPAISDTVNKMLIGKVVLVASFNRAGAMAIDGKEVSGGEQDFMRRKRLLSGHTIAMGRKTYESLPPDFAQNHKILVLSRTLKLKIPNVYVVRSIKEIRAAYEAHGRNLLYFLGAGEFVRNALHMVDLMLLTQVEDDTRGTEMSFKIDATQWKCTSKMPFSEEDPEKKGEGQKLIDEMIDRHAALFPLTQKEQYVNWYQKRFLPLVKIITELREKKQPIQSRFMEMWSVWMETFKTVPAPRRVPFKDGHDVTINYMLEKANDKKIDSDVLLTMRLYGFVEVSKETRDILDRIERESMALLRKIATEHRRLAFTHLTLKKIEAEDDTNTGKQNPAERQDDPVSAVAEG